MVSFRILVPATAKDFINYQTSLMNVAIYLPYLVSEDKT